MTAQILDGKALAKKILLQVQEEIRSMRAEKRLMRLTSLSIGDNPNARLYERNQQKICEQVGIEYLALGLPEGSPESLFLQKIAELNQDKQTTGILLQRPFPPGFKARKLQAAVHPEKDVEGMHPANIGWIIYGTPRLAPCTALAAVELSKVSGTDFKGKDAVVVGHSEIVGKPIAFMLLNEFATATICHVETRDLAAHTRKADLIYIAVGKPGLLTAEMVKPGAVVIDIGINRVLENGKEHTVGDVDVKSVSQVAGYLSPVPGGVGPVTVAMLMRNTLFAAQRTWE